MQLAGWTLFNECLQHSRFRGRENGPSSRLVDHESTLF